MNAVYNRTKHLVFLEDEEFQIHTIEAYYNRCPLAKITTAEFFQSPSDAIERVKLGGVDYFILDLLLYAKNGVEIDGYQVIGVVGRQRIPPKIYVYTAMDKKADERNRFIVPNRYFTKKNGLHKLFSTLEEDILKDEKIICDPASGSNHRIY